MKTKHILLAGLVVLGALGNAPGWAQSGRRSSDARQDDKNLMRNLGGGLGAVALDSLVRGRVGDALVLGAGAAYSGKKYEDARKAQQDENSWRRDDRKGRDGRYNTDAYDRDRYESPSRWERERRERLERERREEERRERLRWERKQRDRDQRHDHDRDCRDSHRH